MRSVRVLVLALSVAAVACGHTETHVALLRAPQPATDRPVELYMADQAPPTRAYYEIALVQALGFGNDATPEAVAKALTTKAANLGCEAVVRTYIDIGYSRGHAAGVCVRYLGPGPAAPPPLLPPAPPKNPSPPPMRPSPTPRIEPLPSAPNQGR